MSVGFYITFLGLLTRRYTEQTPGKDSQDRTGRLEHDSQTGESIINNKLNALINGYP
jgi:hypothetical protein